MISITTQRGKDMPTPDELRKLAAWYSEYADSAENHSVRMERRRIAAELSAKADSLELPTRRLLAA
jgi:hypothetical protein